jgi:hypothetical protein
MGWKAVSRHDRSQKFLLPETVDDAVGADNPARFIDAFVDELDLAGGHPRRREGDGHTHARRELAQQDTRGKSLQIFDDMRFNA